VGNLILAALAERTGSFLEAIELSSRVLGTVGTILPATEAAVHLRATLADGSQLEGETQIAACQRRIRRVSLLPEDAAPAPGVVRAILDAELVVLAPGSLYTSVLPNLAVRGIAEALRQTGAAVVWVANLVSERGESAGMDLADHLAAIEEHAGGAVVDGLLVNDRAVEGQTLRRYQAEGCEPLCWNGRAPGALHVERRPLLAPGPKLRHDPSSTAKGLFEVWAAVARAGVRSSP
jgi:uncharacterized cofD-like protein